MTNFLEKLKKGMGETNVSQEESEKAEETENQEETAEAEAEEKGKEEEKKEEELPKRKLMKGASKKTEVKKKESKAKIKKTEKEFVKTEEIKEEPKRDDIEISALEDEKPTPSVLSKISLTGKENNWFEQEGQLTVDVYQTNKEIVVKSAIAGVKPEDLDISIENEVLLIKGKREERKEEKIKDYYYQECYWGKFSREIVLPEEVDPSKVDATLKDGILTIRIPKIRKGKKINVSEQ